MQGVRLNRKAHSIVDQPTQVAVDQLESAVIAVGRQVTILTGTPIPGPAGTPGAPGAPGGVVSVTAGSTKMSVAPNVGAVVVDVVPANLTGISESGVTNLVSDLAARPTVGASWIAVSMRL